MFLLNIRPKNINLESTTDSRMENNLNRFQSSSNINDLDKTFLKGNHINHSEHRHHKKGDINGDGKIDIDDIKLLKDHLDGKITLDEEQLESADIDNDGKVDLKDLRLMIYRFEERRNLQDRVSHLQQLYRSLSTIHDNGSSNPVSKVDGSYLSDVKEELDNATLQLNTLDQMM